MLYLNDSFSLAEEIFFFFSHMVSCRLYFYAEVETIRSNMILLISLITKRLQNTEF